MAELEQVISDQGLVGWRGYNFIRPHFLSCMGTVLMPYEKNEATCVHAEHLAPDDDCSCGFYSFKTLQKLIADGYQYQQIIAEVYFWGKTIECEWGYRAQYCYPKKLYCNNEEVKPYIAFLADTYGVPFEEKIAFDGIPLRDVHKQPKPRQPMLTFEDIWDAAFEPKVELSIRRFARNQARQRVYMKLRACEQTISNLESSLDRKRRARRELIQQKELLDQLKSELH